MDEITKLKSELERTKMELGILYEISNASVLHLNWMRFST